NPIARSNTFNDFGIFLPSDFPSVTFSDEVSPNCVRCSAAPLRCEGERCAYRRTRQWSCVAAGAAIVPQTVHSLPAERRRFAQKISAIAEVLLEQFKWEGLVNKLAPSRVLPSSLIRPISIKLFLCHNLGGRYTYD